MPVAAAALEAIVGLVGRGRAERDFAALIVERAKQAGPALVPEYVPVSDGLPA